jgi:hypothetical protein
MTGNENVEFAYPRIIHARISMNLQNLLNIIKITQLVSIPDVGFGRITYWIHKRLHISFK